MQNIKLRELPFYILVFLIGLLPFNFKIIPLTIILLTIISLFYGSREDWKNNFLKSLPYTFPLIFFFIWSFASVLWSISVGDTLKDIEHKLSLIVFPLLIPLIKLNRNKINVIIWLFIISCTCMALICLFSSLYKCIFEIPINIEIDFSNDFTLREGFGQVHSLFMHRSYYAMYLCFSLWYILSENRRINIKFIKLIKISLCLILIIGVFLSESKAGIITLCIILVLFFLHKNNQFSIRNKITLFVFFIFFGFIFKNILIERFSRVIEVYDNTFDLDKVYDANTVLVRLKLWESSIDGIKVNPILGYGMGTSKLVLREINLSKGYTPLTIYGREYNTHNQFLEVWLELGIIGFLIFLSTFYSIIREIKKRNFLILGIFSIFLINYLPEVILDRQTGVVFVTIFTTLLCYLNSTKC